MSPLFSSFWSRFGWLRLRGGGQALLTMHLLVIGTLLFSTVAAATPPRK
jgi:hypothetical protein